jgi:hypothetical protein
MLMFLRTVTVALGTFYAKLCFRAHLHDMIHICCVSIGFEVTINGRKTQLNKHNNSGNPVACRLGACDISLRQDRVI